MSRLVLIGLLFTAFFAQAQTNSPALITVNGKSIVYAEPDEVLIDINLKSIDQEIGACRAKGKALAKQVIKYLRSVGIEDKHIQTQYANFGPVYQDYKSNIILRYEANQTIAVCIKALDQLDDIIDGLLGLKVHRIGRPQFRTTKLEELRDQARLEAMRDAKQKAKAMAAVLDQGIGKAYHIQEELNTANFDPNAYQVSSRENTSTSNNSFAKGQLEIVANVKIAFLLE